MKKIAICMPCFGRPQRTKRAIESILAQTLDNWQAFIIGDCCPDFQQIMNANRKLGAESWEGRALAGGNEIIMFNAKTHEGGYGYTYRNFVNGVNNAEFIVYLDNDDTWQPNHLQNYLSGIDGTDNDFVFFNTNLIFVDRYVPKVYQGGLPLNGERGPGSYIRDAQAEYGWIGHAELIIRAQFLKDHPEIQQTSEYGHDWKFIKQMIDAGAKYKKAELPTPTYNIMGAGELRETDID
jgi:glycosyltransferase involved in cell wall biosynthesis